MECTVPHLKALPTVATNSTYYSSNDAIIDQEKLAVPVWMERGKGVVAS
jgi:hypothetical protein